MIKRLLELVDSALQTTPLSPLSALPSFETMKKTISDNDFPTWHFIAEITDLLDYSVGDEEGFDWRDGTRVRLVNDVQGFLVEEVKSGHSATIIDDTRRKRAAAAVIDLFYLLSKRTPAAGDNYSELFVHTMTPELIELWNTWMSKYDVAHSAILRSLISADVSNWQLKDYLTATKLQKIQHAILASSPQSVQAAATTAQSLFSAVSQVLHNSVSFVKDVAVSLAPIADTHELANSLSWSLLLLNQQNLSPRATPAVLIETCKEKGGENVVCLSVDFCPVVPGGARFDAKFEKWVEGEDGVAVLLFGVDNEGPPFSRHSFTVGILAQNNSLCVVDEWMCVCVALRLIM